MTAGKILLGRFSAFWNGGKEDSFAEVPPALDAVSDILLPMQLMMPSASKPRTPTRRAAMKYSTVDFAPFA